MRPPRLRIAMIMLLVGLAAFDLGAVRAVLGRQDRPLFLLCVAALPMANCLAVGLLMAALRPESRRFLMGFVAFGGIASALFLGATMRAEGLVNLYLIPPMALYEATVGPPPRLGGGRTQASGLLVGFLMLSAWASWPQVGLALLGGSLARRIGRARRPETNSLVRNR